VADENGGAIDCGDGSPVVSDCVFINCSAGTGGAVSAQGPALIIGCVFVENQVEHAEYGGHGGGLAVYGTTEATAPVEVFNCVFLGCKSGNQGGAVYVDEECSVLLVNCTFSGNQADDGSGVYLFDTGPVTLMNTVVAFGDPDAAFSGSGDVDISYCNVFGNPGGDWTGPIAGQQGVKGNISLDPFFADIENDDLHLRYCSPCRDSGDSSAPGLPDVDFEGDPRKAYGLVDMGADEFYHHLYFTGDACPGGHVEVKITGVPSSNPVTMWAGTSVLEPCLPTQYGSWHLQLPIVTLRVFAEVPNDGLIVLPSDIPPGYPIWDIPLQALVNGQLTNLCVMEVKG